MTTPRGELVLRRVDGAFEVISNGVFLMDTRDGRSERALVRAAVARHPRGPSPAGRRARRRLLAARGGGSARADRHRRGGDRAGARGMARDAPARPHRLGSARPAGHGAAADVRDHLRASAGRYDIVCLDVDNGPGWTVTEDNAELYGAAGLATCVEALAPGGVLAVWSAHRSPAYEQLVRETLGDARGGRGRGGPRRARRRLPGRPQVRAAFAFMSRRSSGGSAKSRLSSAERTSSTSA